MRASRCGEKSSYWSTANVKATISRACARASASLKAAPPRSLCAPALLSPKNSRSFSTVREFFDAKLGNPAMPSANARARFERAPLIKLAAETLRVKTSRPNEPTPSDG